MFSVTLSVNPDFHRDCSRILRGMLPYGVRTFLQQALRLTSDHLPSAENLARRIRIRKPGSHEWDVLILNLKVGRAVLCAPLWLGHRRARSARPTDSGLQAWHYFACLQPDSKRRRH